MKRFIGLWILVCITLMGHGQKKLVDTSTVRTWQDVDGGVISNDGKWAGYLMSDNTGDETRRVLHVKSNVSGQEWSFKGGSGVIFSPDSRYGAFIQHKMGDQALCILKLGDNQPVNIEGANSLEMMSSGGHSYMVYGTSAAPNTLNCREVSTGKVITYPSVKARTVVGDALLLTTGDEATGYDLKLCNPGNGGSQTVWHGATVPDNIVCAKDGSKIAFVSGGKIWLFEAGKTNLASELPQPETGAFHGLIFESIRDFVWEKGLLLAYRGPDIPEPAKDASPVRVFDYRDAIFGIDRDAEPTQYQVMYNLSNRQFVLLDGGGERYTGFSPDGRMALVAEGPREGEYYWNKKQSGKSYIKDLATGSKIDGSETDAVGGYFDSTGRYLIYQGLFSNGIYSLNMATGNKEDLAKDLPIPPTDNINENLSTSNYRGLSIVNANASSTQLVVYDHYDIWLLDATGKNRPFCITGGYGRANHIVFRFLDESHVQVTKGQTLYLSAVNEDTRAEGFCQVNWKDVAHPVILSMGNFSDSGSYSYSVKPIKAAGVDRWLVFRGTAAQAPNFYWTSDFKEFHTVSNSHPEKDYVWFTTEMIYYTTKDGVKSRAILYKPDDLDSTKKYPVLFNFYEHEAVKLNDFRTPHYTNSYQFNIPMMMAQGYLVCVPDIHFQLGKTAHNIVDCVEGAADAIGTRSYVDTNHMGAAGGSFGGYGVNCLAALSHRFKAIVSVSGLCDLLNTYSNVPGLRDEEVENRQMRMGISLATDPQLFLSNSPVAYTRTVTTPLLIIDNPKDQNVNPQQGIDWFINLRREGKPAWMLWYPNEAHGVFEQTNQIDLCVRMSQFYNHYLKGAPTPKWMTDGLSVWDRSGNDGFTLMPAGNDPGEGLDTKEDRRRQIEYLNNKQAQAVTFTKPANWAAVLQQARTEHKYIFLDVYATWCGPCKMMDENVYANKSIGKLMNDKFISVKVQIDRTDADDAGTKSWYTEADMLKDKYQVSALPALLFFSPDGELLYRNFGYQSVNQFAGSVKFATDPSAGAFRQQLEAYQRGEKNYPELPKLIGSIKSVMMNDSLATTMTEDYFTNYLDKQTDREKVLTHENIALAFENKGAVSSRCELVKEILGLPANLADSLMHWPGATVGLLTYLATREELEMKLCKGGKILDPTPDWGKIEKSIREKYPQVDAGKVILYFQMFGSEMNEHGFYFRVKNWGKVNQFYAAEEKRKLETGDLEGVNNDCWWTYFCRVTDVPSLELATVWMDSCLTRAEADGKMSAGDLAGWIDTRSALLYKAGHRHEAIKVEETAVAGIQKENEAKGIDKDRGCKSYYDTIEEMRKGEKIHQFGPWLPALYPADWKLLD